MVFVYKTFMSDYFQLVGLSGSLRKGSYNTMLLKAASQLLPFNVSIEIISIEEIAPLAVRLEIRYDIVAQRSGQERDERVGTWGTEWRRDGTAEWKATKWQAREETLSRISGPVFIDVTSQALGGVDSY